MLNQSELIEMYEKMFTIRQFEFKVKELVENGSIFGVIHQYIGEEAIAVGAIAAIKKDDYILSNHRGHGHLIARGSRLDKMMAELMGRKTGYCQGKGGSMHIADVDLGILGANGIVGGGIPISVGIGLTSKLKYKNNRVVIVFFGDGAANQGSFHESINLASIWDLPIIFLVENNQYGLSMSVQKSMNIETVAERAKGYGIPGECIDGNDVEKVYSTVFEAAEKARNGEGPILIDAKTYRWKGHSTNDKGLYRSKEEVNYWMERCPIKRLMEKLIKIGVSEERFTKIHKEIQKKLIEAEKWGLNSPFPDPSEAEENLFAN